VGGHRRGGVSGGGINMTSTNAKFLGLKRKIFCVFTPCPLPTPRPRAVRKRLARKRPKHKIFSLSDVVKMDEVEEERGVRFKKSVFGRIDRRPLRLFLYVSFCKLTRSNRKHT